MGRPAAATAARLAGGRARTDRAVRAAVDRLVQRGQGAAARQRAGRRGVDVGPVGAAGGDRPLAGHAGQPGRDRQGAGGRTAQAHRGGRPAGRAGLPAIRVRPPAAVRRDGGSVAAAGRQRGQPGTAHGGRLPPGRAAQWRAGAGAGRRQHRQHRAARRAAQAVHRQGHVHRQDEPRQRLPAAAVPRDLRAADADRLPGVRRGRRRGRRLPVQPCTGRLHPHHGQPGNP